MYRSTLFFYLGTRRGWRVSVTPRPHLTPGIDPVPVVQESGWASGPVWTGAENLAPPGFDPRTVQPVGSSYTDWAIRPIELNNMLNIIHFRWSRWPCGLRPLDCWDCGFESRWGHGCSSVVYCVGSGLCHELITHLEESYQVCVCVCLCVSVN